MRKRKGGRKKKGERKREEHMERVKVRKGDRKMMDFKKEIMFLQINSFSSKPRKTWKFNFSKYSLYNFGFGNNSYLTELQYLFYAQFKNFKIH